ncbi:succinate dehydrogenase, hydrophobic membrane anchor protein [Noviherbaspirillum sp.]|uniref:succinate dehydrogenase, hydrophobic membrane anchor protein n=1 Tax=Noviherbaspirillum sp. TaxID=1926288 RepID=UPI002B459C28|nr:succinate dehydrogenase, hydrophobic membrane anchor protein [Noviherbaspirillum sp.]HJV79644.1 succinate dehydrogenase, hydrophobic membrane anchor protein [Noviherbaspirillum sp.]
MKKALSGLRAWTVQRFTAVYMLLAVLFALVHFAWNAPHGFEAWRAWLGGPLVRMATLLFFVALLLHTWVGLRDVMMDYIKPLALRLALLALLGFYLVGMAAWVMRILLLL